MFEFVDLMACIASQVKEDNQLLLLIHDDVVHMQTNEGKELLLKKREELKAKEKEDVKEKEEQVIRDYCKDKTEWQILSFLLVWVDCKRQA